MSNSKLFKSILNEKEKKKKRIITWQFLGTIIFYKHRETVILAWHESLITIIEYILADTKFI